MSTDAASMTQPRRPYGEDVRAVRPVRTATPRSYLMCPPTYFDVAYSINPWMHPDHPVDVALAAAQWDALRETYRRLGHRVQVIDAVAGLPDMVFAADGGFVVDGTVLGARFRSAHRAGEAAPFLDWFADAGFEHIVAAQHVNEGEGDLLLVGDVVLAGWGFRTDAAAHDEVRSAFGRRVMSLQLVDERYYHLNTALGVLGDDDIAYLPEAFSADSQQVLRTLFPDAVIASPEDAGCLGLNLVSDGYHVVLPAQATALADQLVRRGYQPVGVDVSELTKSGGAVKCCTLELRSATTG